MRRSGKTWELSIEVAIVLHLGGAVRLSYVTAERAEYLKRLVVAHDVPTDKLTFDILEKPHEAQP